VLSHDNREEIYLEINAEETADTERHNRNNCFENVSEVQVVISVRYNKVIPVA
jgi:hypothetical protein